MIWANWACDDDEGCDSFDGFIGDRCGSGGSSSLGEVSLLLIVMTTPNIVMASFIRLMVGE